MIKRQRNQIVFAAHDPDKCGNATNAGPDQSFGFRADIEVGLRDANLDHPPVTGGKKAISVAPVTGASKPTIAKSTAARSRKGSANARA